MDTDNTPLQADVAKCDIRQIAALRHGVLPALRCYTFDKRWKKEMTPGIKRCPICEAPLRKNTQVCPRCESNVAIAGSVDPEVPASDWLPPGAAKPKLGYVISENVNGAGTGKLSCPECRSDQLTAQKKGFGAGKGIAGGVAFGGLGLLAGFLGSRKIDVTCMSCGHSWRPGSK